MVKYHKVESPIWGKGWDNDTLLLAFYLLTCEHRTTEGIYRLPLAYAANDLGWTLRKTQRCMGVLLAASFVEYDREASVVLIVKALKRQAPNTNQAKAAIKQLRSLPPTVLRQRFFDLAQKYALGLVVSMRKDPPEGFGEALPEWLRDSHSSSSFSLNTGGLTSVSEGPNVVDLRDRKTGDQRGAA